MVQTTHKQFDKPVLNRLQNMNDYYRLSLRDAVKFMRAGEMRCTDYIASQLQQIRAMESQIGAWAWIAEDKALAFARAVDAVGVNSDLPLHGIALGIKDVIDVKDVPTRMGSDIYRDHVPIKSAPMVTSLTNAGALILGKTVTAEFAFLAPGKTRNPWNHLHTPGGSSSGSAAAVAAGFVAAALGTQTNGSVIRPAAFCGVVGYKPTQGRLSNDGTLDYAPSLDQLGFFTRNVADVAWLASNVLPLEREVISYARPPRFAAVRSPVWHLVTPAQESRFARDLTRLRTAGADIVETELAPLFDSAHSIHRCIMSYETARFFCKLTQSDRHKVSALLNDFIDEGNRVSESQYENAKSVRCEMQQQLSSFLKGCDAVLTPPASGEAPETLTRTGDPSFCTIWTLCGVPAISIPTGLGRNGLPLGLQIVTGHNEDDKLLSIAKWCENRMTFTPLFNRTDLTANSQNN